MNLVRVALETIKNHPEDFDIHDDLTFINTRGEERFIHDADFTQYNIKHKQDMQEEGYSKRLKSISSKLEEFANTYEKKNHKFSKMLQIYALGDERTEERISESVKEDLQKYQLAQDIFKSSETIIQSGISIPTTAQSQIHEIRDTTNNIYHRAKENLDYTLSKSILGAWKPTIKDFIELKNHFDK